MCPGRKKGGKKEGRKDTSPTCRFKEEKIPALHHKKGLNKLKQVKTGDYY